MVSNSEGPEFPSLLQRTVLTLCPSALRLRSIQDGTWKSLRRGARGHCLLHYHKRGLRSDEPDPHAEGQGRETADLNIRM
jgi:hypothetical protein